MIRHAFKEWAVICRALAEGKQALILRKGGIAEDGGVFRPEHSRFWLYPTYVHQQREGIKPDAASLLEQALREQPAPGRLCLSHYVEVSGAFFVDRLDTALALDKLHYWSSDTVRKRFDYRGSGLYVLATRVFRARTPFELPSTPDYDGCKTWVELKQELPVDGATPVLDDERYGTFLEELDAVLHPTAYA